MGGVVTEEQAISHAQYLDLVYSQTGTLYDLLPDLPRPGTSITSTTPAASHAADGVIGTTHAHSHSVSTTTPKFNSSNVQNALSPAPPAGKTSEVNAVQTTPAVRTNPKKGEARLGRVKTLIRMSKPKPLLLMTGINANHVIHALCVVTITTQRIVRDVPKFISSSNPHRNLLLRRSCLNPSRLNNKLRWSFMINLLHLHNHTF
jgi:hypothetical protein